MMMMMMMMIYLLQERMIFMCSFKSRDYPFGRVASCRINFYLDGRGGGRVWGAPCRHVGEMSLTPDNRMVASILIWRV